MRPSKKGYRKNCLSIHRKLVKEKHEAGDVAIETMMYTYHISNRTDCNGPRLYQAYQ